MKPPEGGERDTEKMRDMEKVMGKAKAFLRRNSGKLMIAGIALALLAYFFGEDEEES